MKLLILSLLFLSFTGYAVAQNTTHGWLAFFNTSRIHKKFSVHFDAQLRSTADLQQVQTLLLRPGINFHIQPAMMVSAGYGFISNKRVSAQDDAYFTEHRVWEQFLLSHRWWKTQSTHRLRLEQRFVPIISESGNALVLQERKMAHRIRYFMRHLISPKGKDFTKGFFIAAQNEVFLHLNPSVLNAKTFDQNRLYGAAGYRFSNKMDIEGGYMNLILQPTGTRIQQDILQLALYKRL